MTNENQVNEYKGFCLFNDIEDGELRNRNRAVVMANMAETHSKDRKISINGAALITGYFNCVPHNERKDTMNMFIRNMDERGFKIVKH